jgi:hypothetical protein
LPKKKLNKKTKKNNLTYHLVSALKTIGFVLAFILLLAVLSKTLDSLSSSGVINSISQSAGFSSAPQYHPEIRVTLKRGSGDKDFRRITTEFKSRGQVAMDALGRILITPPDSKSRPLIVADLKSDPAVGSIENGY